MYVFTTQCFASKVGGIENLITNFALTLSSRHEVTVFADRNLYIQDEIFDNKYHDNLRIFRYGGFKFFRRHKKAQDIKMFINNKNVDCIIADTWKSLEFCIDEINKRNTSVICLAHGNDILQGNERRKKRIIQVFNNVKHIIANSQYTSKLVQDLGVDTNKIHVINPGVQDLRTQEPLRSYNIAGSPVLLTLARLEKRKGHQVVLESLVKLKEDFPQIQYIIAGDGPEKKYLINLAKNLRLSDRVHFFSRINDQQKKEIFDLSSLMVMPTLDESHYGSIEGFGIVFIEAAMLGLPSIATDIGGTSDAIIHNKTGILINSRDDLYSGIKELILDEKKLGILGREAQARAINNYTWDTVIEKYLRLIGS